jgi:hypothetical protein
MTLFLVNQTYAAVNYDCSNAEGQKLQIFQEKPDHATAIFQTALENKILKGNFTYEDDALFEVTKYDLVDSLGQPAPIVVSKKINWGRGGCGRAGCNTRIPELQNKKAILTLNGQEITFNCL